VCDVPQFSNLEMCTDLRFERRKSVKILLMCVIEPDFTIGSDL